MAATSAPHGCTYRFDDVEACPQARALLRGGRPVGIEPKAHAVLGVLLEHAGQTLTREALLDRVWGHRHVTPAVLNRIIAQLRRALGDPAGHPHYIQTLHGTGYRFIGNVACTPASAANAGAAEAAEPAGGVALAPREV